MSCNCNKPKCDGKCGISPSVLQINNPGDCTLFHRVEVPASMGDSRTNPPKSGDYRNVLLYYVADGTSWLFSSDGVPQKLVNGFTNYEDAQYLPSINNHVLLGNMTGSDLGLQNALVAGANIQINDNTISATDTIYTLPTASANTLGGVKIGANLSIDEGGVLSADAQPAILYSGTGQNTDGAMTQKAATDSLSAESDSRIAGDANLQSQINGLASGSPLAASSISEMTDTTRVYVNTTDGHWYYYANNDWIDGGVYQASVDPTDVNNILKYQYGKNLKYFFKFAVGNLNQTTGEVLSPDDGYKYNLITEEILQFNYDIAITSNSYCRTDLFLYNDDNSFDKWFVCANNLRCYKIKAGQKFRIRLAYNTEPSPQPDLTQDDVENALLFINYYACPFEFYKYTQLAKLEKDGYPVDPENLKYSLSLQIGDVGSAGINEGIDQNKRMVTCNVLKYAYDVVIPKNSNFMVYLWTYSDLSGSGATGRGWLPLTTDTYVIPAGTMFRLLFVTSNASTTPLYEVYDNPTFKVFELYKKEEKDVSKEYNKNCRSVAHQGYNPVFGEIGHCKLEAYVEAKKHGFDYGECDIKFSSDGVPVCSHDTSFDSNGVTVVIADHTLAELKTYSYYGGTIATFEEVVSKCKMLGLGLYIDHLNANWPDTNWNTIFYIVKKYQMLDNAYWLLNHVSMASRILTSYNKAKLVLLADSYASTVTAISNANAIKTNLNSVSVDFLFTTVSVSDLVDLQATANSGIEFEAWTLDTADVYKSYMPFVSGITSNKVCYNDVYEELLS